VYRKQYYTTSARAKKYCNNITLLLYAGMH
jgi:hypothetical protein